jgi:hypothetical protein
MQAATPGILIFKGKAGPAQIIVTQKGFIMKKTKND